MAIPSVITKSSERISIDPSRQVTLNQTISLSGVGLFTAEKAELKIHPAKPNTGFQFMRSDISSDVLLPASLDSVVSTPRCTILGNEKFTVHTVEHLLATLYALGIDNGILELNGPEVPIMDGSAQSFVKLIESTRLAEQEAKKEIYTLSSIVSWSEGDVHLVAIPSDELQFSYTLNFPNSQLLHSQYYSTKITPEIFTEEIAPCRTFCFYEEVAPLIESGLIKGGGLSNAVIIKNDMIINPEGIRFPDEMARHKVLDLIGDLSLLPRFRAHIIAIRSGHASNIAFAQKLEKFLTPENA